MKLEVPQKIVEEYEILSKEEKLPLKDLMIKGLCEYIEDYHDIKSAEEAYAEWVADGKKIISLEEVMKRNNLD